MLRALIIGMLMFVLACTPGATRVDAPAEAKTDSAPPKVMHAGTFSAGSKLPPKATREPGAHRALSGIPAPDLVRILAGIQGNRTLFDELAVPEHAKAFVWGEEGRAAHDRDWDRLSHELRLDAAAVPLAAADPRQHSAMTRETFIETHWIPKGAKSPEVRARLTMNAKGKATRVEILAAAPEWVRYEANLPEISVEEARRRLEWTITTGKNYFAKGAPELDVMRAYYKESVRRKLTRQKPPLAAVLEMAPAKVVLGQSVRFTYGIASQEHLEDLWRLGWEAHEEIRAVIADGGRGLDPDEQADLIRRADALSARRDEVSDVEGADAFARRWRSFAQDIEERRMEIAGARSFVTRRIAEAFVDWAESRAKGEDPLQYFDRLQSLDWPTAVVNEFVQFAEGRGVTVFANASLTERRRMIEGSRHGLVGLRLGVLARRIAEAAQVPTAKWVAQILTGDDTQPAQQASGISPSGGAVFVETISSSVTLDAADHARLPAAGPIPREMIRDAALTGSVTWSPWVQSRFAALKSADPRAATRLESLLGRAAQALAAVKVRYVQKAMRRAGYSQIAWEAAAAPLPLSH